MNLVTVDEARLHLRLDNTEDNLWLEMWIPSVSQAILKWLKDDWRAYEPSGLEDSNGDPIPLEDSNGPVVKPMVKAACLVEIAQQYRFRDGSEAPMVPSHWGHGHTLGAGATALLTPLRKGTVR